MVEYDTLGRFSKYGGGGLRTHGTLADTLVFKTRALNHSTTPPGEINFFTILIISKDSLIFGTNHKHHFIIKIIRIKKLLVFFCLLLLILNLFWSDFHCFTWQKNAWFFLSERPFLLVVLSHKTTNLIKKLVRKLFYFSQLI